MKVLSIKQPWASLIAAGRKTIELRSWSTKYRGPILILAGVGVWKSTDGQRPPYSAGPRGVSICVVDLIDVRQSNKNDEFEACLIPPKGFDFSWILENPRPVQRVPVKGRLGLYTDRSLDWLTSNL